DLTGGAARALDRAGGAAPRDDHRRSLGDQGVDRRLDAGAGGEHGAGDAAQAAAPDGGTATADEERERDRLEASGSGIGGDLRADAETDVGVRREPRGARARGWRRRTVVDLDPERRQPVVEVDAGRGEARGVSSGEHDRGAALL